MRLIRVEPKGARPGHIKVAASKGTNPKDAISGGKMPVHVWPMAATYFGAIALVNGAFKYGRANWRKSGVRASVYFDACIRHLADWFEGEDYDPEDGVHNLGAALACIAILVDAWVTGKLNDDRNFNGVGYRRARAMMEPNVARLREMHKKKNPKHWTIADNGGRKRKETA